jgi:2-iminobutanoate/2-iminopropanoate deaminase
MHDMLRKQIFTEKGVKPGGVFSQAIVAQGTYTFVSGQGSFDPATGAFRPGDFREQAEQTFANIGVLLEASGTSWEHVVKVSVFLRRIADFPELNAVYAQYFTEPYPARTTIEAGLVGDMLIEVDCIALVPET